MTHMSLWKIGGNGRNDEESKPADGNCNLEGISLTEILGAKADDVGPPPLPVNFVEDAIIGVLLGLIIVLLFFYLERIKWLIDYQMFWIPISIIVTTAISYYYNYDYNNNIDYLKVIITG